MLIPKPVNDTQRRYNRLCELGGGRGGGPARTKVEELLRESGQALNRIAHREITAHLAEYPDASPWHVCFAVGLSWGHLAQLHPEFTGAAVRLLSDWNDDDLRVAKRFHNERGPEPIEQSLRGGHVLFRRVTLPSALPDTLARYRAAQDRWQRSISADRPKYIGSWNTTAMFMVALFSDTDLAAQLTTPAVLLPPGGPIFAGLSLLHRANVLPDPPSGSDLDDEPVPLGVIFENNVLFEKLHRGLPGWNLLDVHSGLYMLGTRLAESDGWFSLGGRA